MVSAILDMVQEPEETLGNK